MLVLDDYHTITDPRIHAELRQLIERMPRAVHVALASQVDPPLRLGRMRAMGELAELRDRELRFSDEEAETLLNRVHGLDLSAAELTILQARIEGWPAGLNLAALSLAGRQDRGRVLDELPAEERYLVDYLWEEVVLAQPRDVRQFLMHTAILTRLTGRLCDAVAQREESDLMLRELERANLFVVALDPAHEWFRCHHLFRELLLRQLRRFAPELIADLHRRASAWLAEHGLMVDAIDHAITAGDVHYAADEIERRWLEFYSTGQATTLLGWINRRPQRRSTHTPCSRWFAPGSHGPWAAWTRSRSGWRVRSRRPRRRTHRPAGSAARSPAVWRSRAPCTGSRWETGPAP